MLVTFHQFAILIYEIFTSRKRLKEIPNNEVVSNYVVDQESRLKFHPPVFKQRLSKVYKTIINEKWRNNLKKLVDLGCAEFDLFMYLKNLNLEQITFVDIDETALRENLGKLEPLLADRLRRRAQPLEVLVFRGSAIDPDYRLRKTDVVTAIELIEHLYPDTLEALPYNIFSFMKPKLVIITTPNADFNVVFQREGLRHPDHKFEWTRQQFEDWATNITQRFTDYTVEFSGVGKLLDQPENIGHCSQAAIFIRKDLLNEKYISPAYAKKCQCNNTSPCKGQKIDCKLLCNCMCALCLPDFSVGVCKYLSCNIKESEAYRPMKTWPKHQALSGDAREPRLELFSNIDDTYAYNDHTIIINPLYNIFYKLIMKIDYPYEVDPRSETERLIEMFKYRINTFSSFNNRFYNQKTGLCEIPLIDLMYGDICVSNEEIRNLLCEAGYKLEKCRTPQTGAFELCIVSTPHEMDDIESTTSEESEEYHNSISDEASNIEPTIDPNTLSDWDEIPPETQTCSLVVGANPSAVQPKPNTDPLFDSGYLNSPSPLDPVPQEDLPEADQFEEATASLLVGDNRLQTVAGRENDDLVARPLPIIMTTTNYRTNLDPRRNELDRFHNMAAEYRTYRFEDYHHAVPSTSCSPPKAKKLKDKDKCAFEKKLFREPTVLDDAKSLANMILKNSLNIINEDDAEEPSLEIMNLLEEEEEEEPREVILEAPVVAEAPIQAMENGDLANNNRDNEGNNLEHNEPELEVDEGIDLLNDNLEENIIPPLEDNVNLLENNNDLQAEAPAEEFFDAEVVENEPPAINELESSESLAGVSREVLFDENSEQDLLEDFDIMMPNDDSFGLLSLMHTNYDSGITLTRAGSMPELPVQISAAGLEQDFPDWLLHLLGNHIPEELDDGAETSRFASHCYCQGDGLGVHPSMLAVDVEADDESESTDSSNNTQDFAEVDPGPSEMFDMSSLTRESSVEISVTEHINHDTEVFIDLIIKQAEDEVYGRLVENNPEPNKSHCVTPSCSKSSDPEPGEFNVPPTPHNSLNNSIRTIGSFSSWDNLTPKREEKDPD